MQVVLFMHISYRLSLNGVLVILTTSISITHEYLHIVYECANFEYRPLYDNTTVIPGVSLEHHTNFMTDSLAVTLVGCFSTSKYPLCTFRIHSS